MSLPSAIAVVWSPASGEALCGDDFCEERLQKEKIYILNVNSIYFGIYCVSVEGRTKGEGEEPFSPSANCQNTSLLLFLIITRFLS